MDTNKPSTPVVVKPPEPSKFKDFLTFIVFFPLLLVLNVLGLKLYAWSLRFIFSLGGLLW